MLPEECAQKSSLQGKCTRTTNNNNYYFNYYFPPKSQPCSLYKILFFIFIKFILNYLHRKSYYLYYYIVFIYYYYYFQIIIISIATADACLSRRRFLRLWRFGGLEERTLLLPTWPWHFSYYGNGTVYFLESYRCWFFFFPWTLLLN